MEEEYVPSRKPTESRGCLAAFIIVAAIAIALLIVVVP
jgi:hypothetical protein